MRREEALKVAKPILFNTQMVRAIDKGIGLNFKYYKTCTRKIVKFINKKNPNWTGYHKDGLMLYNGKNEVSNKKPAYKAGDILYVRETWAKDSTRYLYKAYYSDTEKFYMDGKEIKLKWKPSIHMPKEAARIFLRITEVKLEKLQDMDGLDALYEGVYSFVHPQASYFDRAQREAFVKLWDSTIKKADLDKYRWEANPWVWVYEFERVEVEG